MKLTNTIFITTHSRTEYLKYALESVYNQTRPPEFIAVLSSSGKDYSNSHLSNPRSNLCYYNFPSDDRYGYVYKLNRGLELATTDTVVFLNDDDMLHPQFLEKTLSVMENQIFPIVVVYPNVLLRGTDNRDLVTPEWTFENIKKSSIPTGATLLNTEIARSIGFQDGLAYCDWDFYWSIMERGYDAYHLDEFLFTYRTHENQWSRVCDVEKETKKVLERHEHS